jgi:hypothetical protein
MPDARYTGNGHRSATASWSNGAAAPPSKWLLVAGKRKSTGVLSRGRGTLALWEDLRDVCKFSTLIPEAFRSHHLSYHSHSRPFPRALLNGFLGNPRFNSFPWAPKCLLTYLPPKHVTICVPGLWVVHIFRRCGKAWA